MQETFEGTRALFAVPDGDGPFPGVVVIHEALGLNDDIRGIVERFVDAGYATFAPDLYGDGVKVFCVARTVLDVYRRSGTITTDRIVRLARRLGQRPEVNAHRIGVIGFCMGGGLAVLAASRGDFAAASVNYGEVPRDTSRLAGICPVVASYGAEDERLLPSAERLRDALDEMDVAHDVKVYEGAGHSFLNRSVPRVAQRFATIGYEPEQAEDGWRRIFAFFGDHLVETP